MDSLESRLQKCFAAVFPGIPSDHMATASQASVEAWDSVATVTLLNVVEEEFGVTMDLEDIENLSSFESITQALKARAIG